MKILKVAVGNAHEAFIEDNFTDKVNQYKSIVCYNFIYDHINMTNYSKDGGIR